MFNFMKKAGAGSANAGEREKMDREEKERRKREKKLRKEAKNFIASSGPVSGSMSTEELLRLDEVRKSLKIRGRRKEKEKLPSGITADYSAEFFAAFDIDRSTLASGDESVCGSSVTTSSEQDRGNDEIMASVSTIIDYKAPQRSFGLSPSALTTPSKYRSLPQVPPKPPKRGILKGSRGNIANIHEELIIATPDPQLLLMRNTIQNELLYEIGAGSSIGTLASAGSSISPRGTSFTSVDSLRSDEARPVPDSPLSNLHVLTSPSPSAESLTDTTNSSFATPLFSLSPVGEAQGSDRWSRVHNFEDIYLPLPPIELAPLPTSRQLKISRQKLPRNDFGFSLRKAICFDRTESLLSPAFRPVIFAEPGSGGGSTGLLPGDRLLRVNGIEVKELSREVIIEMIRNSGEYVTVEVQPVYELVELSRRCINLAEDGSDDEPDRRNKMNCSTLKRSASKRFKQQVPNAVEGRDANIPSSSSGDELVWLVHRGGFCAAIRLPQQKAHREGHKVVVQLLHNAEKLTVDEDDIEKQNPTTMSQLEDICELKHLNESSVLHVVRQRFGSNLVHTNAGPVMLIVNPMAPLSLYSEKVVSMFRGCKTEDMPPHIYSLAQTAYRTMLETRRDQSLVFMGRSGSGKTTSFKHALYFLALATGSCNNHFTAEKVNAVNTILEAFGNTKTCLNANATRFSQIFSLDFDQTGQIASASVQVLLPERQLAGRRHAPDDHSFLIMTRLVAGAEGQLQKELHLDNISSEDNHPFVSLPQKLDERHRAAADFMRTAKAFDVLNIEPKAVRGLWNILASIYHLGIAGATKSGCGSSARFQFANPNAARKAAGLLGVSMDELLAAAFNTSSSEGSSPSKTTAVDTVEAAWESLEALVVGLYAEALAAVVALINKTITTAAHAIASILLLDTPGFQNPASCGAAQSGASLSDLRHNYLQERLQMLFHHNALVAPKDRYAQELIEVDVEGVSESHPGPMISLIDKAPQGHVVRTSQCDLRDQDRRGLLWLLDEESMYPNSNDDTFLERLFSHYGDREYQSLLRRCTGPKQFVLQHLQGTNPVLYNADGWVRRSREHSAVRNALSLLQDSSKDDISRLYAGNLSRGTGGMLFCGSIVALDGTQSLRRVSSIRRSFTSTAVKRNSVLLQMKFTVDGIIDTLRRTGTHFVHCFLLQHNAGHCSSVPSVGGSPNASTLFNTVANGGDIVNIPLLRSQIRGSQILEAARLHRMGFPEAVPLSEFVRRFGLLAGDGGSKETSVEDILTTHEVETATYRVGPSQIFFRSGVLCELEAKRDVLLSDRIIQFQARCRGFLARKQMARRRVQELAVRCIQRNVKSFLSVRDWPWWRLLVRVTPLLNVHRTEEQLIAAKDDLAALRTKLAKVESERNLLKMENQKLELKPEVSAGTGASPHTHNSAHDNPSGSIKPQPTPEAGSVRPTATDQNASATSNNGSGHSLSARKNSSQKFLGQVLAAMMDPKPLTVSPPAKSARQKPTDMEHASTLNHRGATNNSDPSKTPQPRAPRPPVPPQTQARLRQHTKATTDTRPQPDRCRSPLKISASAATTPTTFDIDDSFLQAACDGVALTGAGGGTKAALPAPHAGPAEQATASTEPTPIKVSLNLAFKNLDSMAALRPERFRARPTAPPRSPSPVFSVRSGASSRCSSQNSRGSYRNYSTSVAPAALLTPPRRVFPQSYTRGSASLDLCELRQLEAAPVVFDANLSFVLGCKKQPLHHGFKPSPSHQDPQTSSAYLTEKIQSFLRRTDHVQEEWSALSKRSSRASSGRSTPTNSLYDDCDTISLIERQRERASMERCSSLGRSRSAQNILAKAYQLSRTLPRTPTSRANSVAKECAEDDDDRTIHEEDDNEMDELSEMTIDFTEERSAANINGERLEAETAERLKLEKELAEQQNKVMSLQETTEKLEMELICARSDLNGISEDEEHDNEDGAGGIYKLKYDRVARELEFTKRRLHTQHEHDLEQLVGLKKQLEKKLCDAYEEVEEQRQVVGQWKRKTQKLTNEMNDLRMMLEEQNVRNNLLEKKQRKFDAECQSLQDAARQERQAKDRLSREMDVLIAEKFALEQSLADTRLDLDLKEEKLASVQRELEEMSFGVGTEEEVAQLRRFKNELDRRVKEQDEELDEMAGQVQLLEQAKLRLEMSLETMRKEARRDAQQRDEELEEARGNAYKKIKALECQLESEHEERTLLLREKHELERRLAAAADQDRAEKEAEEAATQKLRRDVRKYKALLKDSQTQLERLKADTPGKALMRQLRNQLEDAEAARAVVLKARQAAEAELTEVQGMFEEANRCRSEAEERALTAQRERTTLQAQVEENEEELAELMKKYSSTVKQLNTEQIAASEYEFKLSELEAERNILKDQVRELQQRLENVESLSDPSTAMTSKRLELRSKELESRLELEQATRTRIEVQVARHKEALEKLQQELSQAKVREKQAQDVQKKSQKCLRELREEFQAASGREQESIARRKDLEKKLEQADSEASSLRNDLRLALQRIADLQQAMEEEVDDDDGASDSDATLSSDPESMVDSAGRLRPLYAKSNSATAKNSSTAIQPLVHEKDDSSPRITLTSPSSNNIHKAVAAKKTGAVDVADKQPQISHSGTLNGDSSSA